MGRTLSQDFPKVFLHQDLSPHTYIMATLSEFQTKKLMNLFENLYDQNGDGVIEKVDFDECLEKIVKLHHWSSNEKAFAPGLTSTTTAGSRRTSGARCGASASRTSLTARASLPGSRTAWSSCSTPTTPPVTASSTRASTPPSTSSLASPVMTSNCASTKSQRDAKTEC